MKKSEKTENTKRRILLAALTEFGKNGFEGATINDICREHNISKGLIYHNFTNKEDLYLQCVQHALQSFMDYMKENDISGDLKDYMDLRYSFFDADPLISRIFFEAVLQPPPHLVNEIKLLKKDFDAFNRDIYRLALKKMTLREGVTEKEAVAYFSLVQEMFNGYFSSSAYTDTSFADIISDHEKMLARILDFMLYGIVKEV